MKVLLVDDNELNLEIQKCMLEGCELEVDTADSGERAVELVKSVPYSMIFMDIQMPVMDGFETAAMIRRGGGNMPIIALSADKIAYDDERFIKSGMNGSVMKPLQHRDLNKLLSGYLHQSLDNKERNDTDAVFDGEGFSAIIPNKAAAAQILEQFFTVHSNDCDVLRDRIAAGNILGARELMHDIVGISGNLCCGRLYGAANTLRGELRQGRSDSLGDFTAIWEQTIAEMRKYHDIILNGNDAHDENEKGTEESIGWDVLWKDFTELCGILDVAAVKLFRRNTKAFAENLGKEKFELIKNAVERYDFLTIISMTQG